MQDDLKSLTDRMQFKILCHQAEFRYGFHSVWLSQDVPTCSFNLSKSRRDCSSEPHDLLKPGLGMGLLHQPETGGETVKFHQTRFRKFSCLLRLTAEKL